MLHTNTLANYHNQTLISIPWQKTVAWLMEGSHYVHVELTSLGDDHTQGSIKITEVYHHNAWIYGVFWLLLGVLITIILHIPIYAVIGKQRGTVKLQNASSTCPPKYENEDHVIDVPHNQSFLPSSLSTKTLTENDKVAASTNTEGGQSCPGGATDNK